MQLSSEGFIVCFHFSLVKNALKYKGLRILAYILILLVGLITYLAFKEPVTRNEARGLPANDDVETENSVKSKAAIENTQVILEKSASKDEHYIVDCRDGLSKLYDEKEATLYDDISYVETLITDKDTLPTKFVHAMVFAKNRENSENAVSLLTASLKKQPGNKLFNYALLLKCIDQAENQLCNKQLADEASKSDSENAAVWLLTATNAASKGNISDVNLFLKKAVAAGEYNSYWAESVDMFDQALHSIGYDDDKGRIEAAVEYVAATTFPSFSELVHVCRVNAYERVDLAQNCLLAGGQMAAEGKTRFDQVLGYSIQKAVYRALNDQNNLNEIDSALKKITSVTEAEEKARALMNFDIDLMHYWFEQIKTLGENESSQMLVEEAARLSMNSGYNPCAK